ncbi:hypothetical protein B0H10DRAFT_2003181 [Mycena sp. CBHHK59/15]|nr:hypothetical protein B0H10DRAFT_2003181 [Mycena sp. CBHHK59/15]
MYGASDVRRYGASGGLGYRAPGGVLLLLYRRSSIGNGAAPSSAIAGVRSSIGAALYGASGGVVLQYSGVGVGAYDAVLLLLLLYRWSSTEVAPSSVSIEVARVEGADTGENIDVADSGVRGSGLVLFAAAGEDVEAVDALALAPADVGLTTADVEARPTSGSAFFLRIPRRDSAGYSHLRARRWHWLGGDEPSKKKSLDGPAHGRPARDLAPRQNRHASGGFFALAPALTLFVLLLLALVPILLPLALTLELRPTLRSRRRKTSLGGECEGWRRFAAGAVGSGAGGGAGASARGVCGCAESGVCGTAESGLGLDGDTAWAMEMPSGMDSGGGWWLATSVCGWYGPCWAGGKKAGPYGSGYVYSASASA